jgi:MraZ protein
MTIFTGQAQHTLDAKGRLILPAKYRDAFENGGFLAPTADNCVGLYTPGVFARQAEIFGKLGTSENSDDRARSRVWSSYSNEVEVDRQGRFAVPSNIRVFAGLDSEVLIVGHNDHIELWDPERFARHTAASLVSFQGVAFS